MCSPQQVPQGVTFFGSVVHRFPDADCRGIRTDTFLKAAQEVVRLVELLGKVFAPVRYDITNNIDKLYSVYHADKDRCEYLHGMVLGPRDATTDTCIDALQWLRRGLSFISRFFHGIVDDHGLRRHDDITKYLRAAYADTLQQYHGWMTQQLFNLICRMCPSREQFFELLSAGRKDMVDMVVHDMRAFNTNLSRCVAELEALYRDHDLETRDVV